MKFSSLFLFLSFVASFSGAAFASPRMVDISSNVVPEQVLVVSRSERALYLGLGGNRAIKFPVAVPANEPGKKWLGKTSVVNKVPWPEWQAPESVLKAHPEFRGKTFASGASDNPMGAAALQLADNEAAIHGTTLKMRKSIGTAVSFGCVRMLNEDVQYLFPLVKTGATVCMGENVEDAIARCRVAGDSQTAPVEAQSNDLFSVFRPQ